MKKIDGTPKSIRELFTGVKYTIHYYQREYQWQTKQIEELLSDLTEEFFEFYSDTDERSKVLDYGHYFMGSIVLTNEENAIIDGQQRLTSLTLLLIYLYHQLEDEEERAEVLQLIYSKKAGTKTYNIHVPEMPERFDVMNALLQKEYMDVSKHSETIKNIYNRFYDIEAIMNDTLPKNTIEMFKDWLIDNVDFIRIVAQTEQDAHKIFVSMNDRGLSLTPTEMLKGYLLSKIENDSIRQQANDLWKKRILDLKGLGKEEESDFIKNWIRSQYAETIRERKKNASPGDFDIIGTAFHKWIREHSSQMKLLRSKDYEDFVLKQFDKFSHIYLDLKNYSTNYTPGFESVFYNGNRNFTLQFQLILASIDPNETKEESDKKIKLISCFLDLYFTRRIFNYKTVDYSAIVYNVFLLSKKFRRKSIVELLEILHSGDTLIVTELSRIGRSTSEVIDIINEFMKKEINIIIIKQNLKINLHNKNDPISKIMLTILSLFAELERDLISHRTKEALKNKKAQGILLGKPIGTIQKSIFDKDKDRIIELLKLGLSVRKIAKTHLKLKHYNNLNEYINKRKLRCDTIMIIQSLVDDTRCTI